MKNSSEKKKSQTRSSRMNGAIEHWDVPSFLTLQQTVNVRDGEVGLFTFGSHHGPIRRPPPSSEYGPY